MTDVSATDAEQSLPGLDSPQPDAATPYRVLARKYRPTSFDDLIGQDAMVRTLTNAFATNRIHQAYILTGVRGVGKTTTARILARAFNYSLPPQGNRPSVEMPALGVHCQAIIESRHIDVIEMDAASHTGVDDVREIVENSRYLPVSARTKVYIVDEVHMLSKAAFNALLKTLEEPPPHVKFLFATTEIDKVPITIRSRCIRFDLKRIEPALLARHLQKICRAEHVEADEEALALIARVAEGSVRDSLSLLDQAFAHAAAERVRIQDVREMLGLSDRGEIIALFTHAMHGEIAAALEIVGRLYHAGADASEMLIELAEFCHLVTRMKISGGALVDPGLSEVERSRSLELAQRLGVGVLTRAWTLLFKGVEDIKDSPRPLASAEMTLIKLAYAADLPGPEEALRRLAEGGAISVPARPSIAPAAPVSGRGGSAALRVVPTPQPYAGIRLDSFEAVVAMAREKRDVQFVHALERFVRLDRFEPGRIEFTLAEGGPTSLAQAMTRKLNEWTGERWMVALAQHGAAPTLYEIAQSREAETLSGIAAHPLVRKVMERFPGAKIVLPQPEPPAPAAEPEIDADVVYEEPTSPDDDF